VFVWDMPSFHLRQAFGGGRGKIEAIAIDRAGDHIAVLTAEQAQMWPTPQGRLRKRVPGTKFAISGDKIVAADKDTIVLESILTPAGKDRKLIGDGSFPGFHANAKLIVLVGGGVLLPFDATSGLPTGEPHALEGVEPPGDAPHLIFVIDSDGRTARVRDLAKELCAIPINGKVLGHAISPDGTRVAILYASSIDQRRVDGGAQIRVDSLPEKHDYAARYSAANNRLVLYSHVNAMILDADTGRHRDLHRGAIGRAELSADGNRVALGVGNTVQLWDAAVDSKQPLYSVSATIPGSFALDAKGELLATGSVDGQVRIWDVQGRLLDRLVASQSEIERLAFAVNDTRLIAQSRNDQIAIWDVHVKPLRYEDIAELVARSGAWELVDGKLTLKPR
jgi:hypothetical protein